MNDGNINSESLPWTGERYLPDVHGSVELEHFHRYLFAAQVTSGKRVLDIASGEGYGSAILARSAAYVTGVDISSEAILHAKEKYKTNNLEFLEGSCAAIPLPGGCIDIVVSFETIEHHNEHEAMMNEIKRVLKPGGLLVISCPDKLEYSDKPAYCNEYHVKELYREEFVKLLGSHFKKYTIFGQRAAYGSLILQEDKACLSETYRLADKDMAAIPGLSNAVYLIAIAADGDIPPVKVGLLDQDLLRINEIVERDAWIVSLTQTIESLVMDRDSQKEGIEQLQGHLEKLTLDRDAQVSQLSRVIAERDERVLQLSRVIAEREEWISQLNRQLEVIFKSRSWRLTSPLRWLARKVSRAKSLAMNNRYTDLKQKYSQNQQALANTTLEIEKRASTEQNNSKFRILLVSHFCPGRTHAGGLRILDIYTLIGQQCPNVQLDLLTFHRPSIDWSLEDVHRIFHNVYLSPAEVLTPEVLAALQTPTLRYDVIDLQFHQSGYQIDAFRRIGEKIIFTPMESLASVALINLRTNLMTTNSARLLKTAASLRLAAEEVVFALKADQVICVSRADAALLRALTSAQRVRSVDTGVSQFEFAKALDPNFVCNSAENRRCNVLYVAYFGSETNVAALRWYLDNVHPIVKSSVPDYVLTVVGRGDLSSFSSYRDDCIEFVGEVAAIAPHIQVARVGIAPAITGSGFRGKVNQYAILGVPSVVSPIAHKGLAYQDGENIYVAEKPRMFADRCIQLLTDMEVNDRMGKAARELCLANYSWQSKWPTIRKIYNLDSAHDAS